MRHAHRAGLRTTATMMYGHGRDGRGAARAPVPAARAAGRDRRLHRVHHLELSARAHRAGRRRGDRRRLPAHAGDRADRARQLRQPAGLVGDAGRQGRAAEPGLRRQRHGQRDDRGERRPRRRRQLLHGRDRDRPQHRERRLRREAAQHALRDPRRPDLPRARRAAHAGARRRARRGRHQPRPRDRSTTPRAAPPRSGGVSSHPRAVHRYPTASVPSFPAVTDARYIAPPGCCRSRARRSATAGSRSTAARDRRRRAAADRPSAIGRRMRPRSAIAASSCPGSSTRTRTSSCRGCASRLPRRHVDAGAGRAALMALRRGVAVDPLPGDAARRLPRRSRSGTSADRRRRQHLATYRRCCAECGCPRMVFRELIGFTVDDPEEAIAAAAGCSSTPCRSRPTLRVDAWHRTLPTPCRPPLLAGARRAHAPDASAGDPPWRVSQRSSSCSQTGRGSWRRSSRRWARGTPAWQPPGCGPVDYLERLGLLDRRLRRRPRRAVRPTRSSRGWPPRGATLVTCPAQQRWTGAGAPPIARFYQSGVRVAFGTDSLASVDELELFDEMAAVRRIAPGVPARPHPPRAPPWTAPRRLASTDLGTIAAGKRAAAARRSTCPADASPMWKNTW